MTIDELKKEVLKGYQYRKIDDAGNAEGCLLPIYLLYPELTRYGWIADDMLKSTINILKRLFQTIEIKAIEPCDIMAFRMPFRQVHIGVYCGNYQMVHCTKNTGLEISSTTFFISRIEGVFRWQYPQRGG